MTKPAVEFTHISKSFKGYVQQSVLTRSMNRMRGKVKVRDTVRALKDVSFELHSGKSVALMGLNGSGKTTALSLIARISSPTSGSITVRGRVGALLAVGTGLHGEMTGRENIEVYSRILGYSTEEVRRKFDDIVDFAEIAHALDRPLKFYSSGMQLRLGFSIAAHVEPEVMLVDEAVSVGDALFQQRCLDRMTELVKGGCALMLVSHQPDIVARTCQEGMLLREGELVSSGPMDQIIGEYLQETGRLTAATNEVVELVEWDVSDVNYKARTMRIKAIVRAPQAADNPRFGITISDLTHGPLISASMLLEDVHTGTIEGTYDLSCEIADIPLRPGLYRVVLFATTSNGGNLALAPHVLGHVTWGDGTARSVVVGKGAFGPVTVPTHWDLAKQN